MTIAPGATTKGDTSGCSCRGLGTPVSIRFSDVEVSFEGWAMSYDCIRKKDRHESRTLVFSRCVDDSHPFTASRKTSTYTQRLGSTPQTKVERKTIGTKSSLYHTVLSYADVPPTAAADKLTRSSTTQRTRALYPCRERATRERRTV